MCAIEIILRHFLVARLLIRQYSPAFIAILAFPVTNNFRDCWQCRTPQCGWSLYHIAPKTEIMAEMWHPVFPLVHDSVHCRCGRHKIRFFVLHCYHSWWNKDFQNCFGIDRLVQRTVIVHFLPETFHQWPQKTRMICSHYFHVSLYFGFVRLVCSVLETYIQGGLKKISHYQESSLNRFKNRQCGYISHQLWI